MSSVQLLLLLRTAKLLAVFAYAAGSLGATFPMPIPLATRRRIAATLAGPGFGLTWALGFVLAGLTGRSFLSWWILSALLLSVVGLQGVLFAVGREGRAGRGSFGLVLVTLVATVVVMVYRG